jgi:hypothetical protein
MGWSTVLITALGSMEKPVQSGLLIIVMIMTFLLLL